MKYTNCLVYISGPITAKGDFLVEGHVVAGLMAFKRLMEMGIPSFCPHLTGMFPSLHLIPHQIWMDYDFAIIDRCTHLLMLPRWQDSPGALMEYNYAKELGLPIAYNVPELVNLLMEGNYAKQDAHSQIQEG